MKQQKKPARIWLLGRINWYDPTSGKGSIVGDDGNWYRIHEFSRINASKKLKSNIRVKFELSNDSIHPIIKTVSETTDQTKAAADRYHSRNTQKVRSI